jgi:hypothetical protein
MSWYTIARVAGENRRGLNIGRRADYNFLGVFFVDSPKTTLSIRD